MGDLQGDNRSREGYGGHVKGMRGDDRDSIQGVMGMMRIPIGTWNSKISLLSDSGDLSKMELETIRWRKIMEDGIN